MRLGVLIALLVALAAPAVAEGARWEHPWMHPRMFDARHPDWQGFDVLTFFGYVASTAETTLERRPDGSLSFVWEAEFAISDPAKLPQLLDLDSLSAARGARVVEFEARFQPEGGRPQVLDRRRLVERAASQHAMYFDGDVVLSLIPPREEPGRLSVRLVTESEPHAGFAEYFGGVQFVQLNAPCHRRVITLRVPESEPLRVESRFFDARPKERVRKGVRQVQYVFEHLLPTFSDPSMPPSLDAFPSLIYSNQSSWEDLAAIARAAWEPHLVAEPAMEAWARELVADVAPDRRRMARAIHDAVGDGWGYLGFYPGESGWIPHPAPVCYAARLGDCKDRTALMVVLMRAVGLDASPAILWSGQAFDTPRVPTLVANHAIVHVDVGDGGPPMFLDSVDVGIGADLLRGTLSGRDALVLGEEPGLVRVPDASREHWLEEDEAFVSVQPDGSAQVFLVRHWHGQQAAARKQMHAGPDRLLWERALRERLAATYPEAEVQSIVQHPHPEDDQVWRLEVTLSSPGFVQRTGSFGVLTPPWIVRWSRDVEREERRHPRVVEGSWFRSTVRIFLPRGVEVIRTPDAEAATAASLLSSAFEIEQRPGEVALTLSVEAAPGRLAVADGEARAGFYRRIATWQDQAVVLRFPAGAEAEE